MKGRATLEADGIQFRTMRQQLDHRLLVAEQGCAMKCSHAVLRCGIDIRSICHEQCDHVCCIVMGLDDWRTAVGVTGVDISTLLKKQSNDIGLTPERGDVQGSHVTGLAGQFRTGINVDAFGDQLLGELHITIAGSPVKTCETTAINEVRVLMGQLPLLGPLPVVSLTLEVGLQLWIENRRDSCEACRIIDTAAGVEHALPARTNQPGFAIPCSLDELNHLS